MADITKEQWTSLAQRKVFFGHQSVGRNIMAGVKDLLAQRPELLADVVTTNDPASVSGPAFIDANIGKNGDPLSKTREFATALEKGMTESNGIALHKYCYVDVTEATDIERLFADYRTQMQELRAKHPNLTIVHVTMPLRVEVKSAKESLKRLLGRGEPDLNIKRNHFNRLLLAEYDGKEPVFDLAAIESTRADGSRIFSNVKGERVYSLAPEWSNDGGHLNETGRRMVAEQLLIFLAGLPTVANVAPVATR